MSIDPGTMGTAERASRLIAYTASEVFAEGAFAGRKYIVVDGEVIAAIVDVAPPSASVVDFREAAIYPSAVNTHTHSFQSLLRGCVDGIDLGQWLERVYASSADYGPEECYLGAALSFGEMLRSGTTAVADFFYLNARGNENVHAVIRAATDIGIRLVMGRAGLDAEVEAPWRRFRRSSSGSARLPGTTKAILSSKSARHRIPSTVLRGR